jgi:betaine-aldehyde dehydrogenase
MAELAQEAGVPDGVFNVVFGGAEVGRSLVQHPLLRKVSFTGSTRTGKEVMKMAADGIKRVSLELGGKSASIVFADADIEKAANSVWSVFANAGQDCCARSRMLVQRAVYAEYIERFVENVRQIRLGDPQDDATQMGCLISEAQRERVAGYVQQGKAQGAKLCAGGASLSGDLFDKGSFYAPTVFSDVSPEMVIAQEEIFGPVAGILPFDTEEEAIRIANATPYGLSGSLWTRDVARALRVARQVEAGVLSINTNSSVHLGMPFGGFKQSGIGRELSPHALECYSELKSVFISAE